VNELPSGWIDAELPLVCKKITDGTHHSPINLPKGKFKYVTAKNIRPWGLDLENISYVDAETHREIYARCPVEKDDVLYIKDGATTGLAVVNPLGEPFSMLSSVALIKPNRELLEPGYLKYWLNSPDTLQEMLNQMTGTAIRRLTLTTISAQSIPLPPLPEQRRIVAKIDSLTGKSKRARYHLNHIPLLVRKYKQAVLAEAYNKNHASAVPLAPLADFCSSIADGDHQAPPRAVEGVPFITISAMNSGRIDLAQATRFVPPSYAESLKSIRKPQVGDVLYSVTGSYGIPALVRESTSFVFQRHIAILRPDPVRCDPQWLAYIMAAPQVLDQAAAVATGTAQLTVPLGALRAFYVPNATLREQREVVRRIEHAFTWIDRLTSDATSARKLVDHLDQAVLAKAFRGELVPQDSGDERASVLLDQIAAEHRTGTGSTSKLKKKRKAKT
jgi:type I restriction enzyme S subunit